MVEVEGERLVVTMAGTAYRTVFFKGQDGTPLCQSPAVAVDVSVPMDHRDFEAMAWEAANAKARELGWV